MPITESSGRRRRPGARKTSYRESSSGDESNDDDDILPKRRDGDRSAGGDDSTGTEEEPDAEEQDTSSTVDEDGDQTNDTNNTRKKKSSFLYVDATAAVEEQKDEDDDDPPASQESKVCQHCNKQFSTPSRLRYHLDKMVCRKQEQSASSEAKKTGPEKTKQTSKKTKGQPKQKFRGKVEDRTCHRCKRVFTSLLGFQYHRDKKVCEKGKKQLQGTRPFYSLSPGQQFATKYGTVEVIRDERQVPTAPPIEDLQTRMKRFTSAKSKRDVQLKKRIANDRVDSIVRRRILSSYYSKHGITHESVLEAYSIGEEGKLQQSIKPKEPSMDLPQDPTAPDNSYPDRIVECKWIPDERPRQDGEASGPMEGKSTDAFSGTLHLQRRELTTPYSADTTRLFCSLCWQGFLSKSGYRHHFDSKSCELRARKVEAEKGRMVKSVEIRAKRKIQLRFSGRLELLQDMMANDDDASDDGGQVALSEKEGSPGFVVGDAGPVEDRKSSMKAKTAKIEVVKEVRPKKPKSEEPLVSPDVVLLELQSEFQLLQGRLLGPIYPQVWASLGFKKPRKKRVRRSKANANKRMKEETLQLPCVDDHHLLLETDGTEWAGYIETAAAMPEPIPEHSLTSASALTTKVTLDITATSYATSTHELEKKPAGNFLFGKSVDGAKESEATSSRTVVPFSLFRASGCKIASPAFVPVSKQALEASESTKVGAAKDCRDFAPMIDIQVFIGEVDSGRYPSMKRHHIKHDEVCSLCRKKVVDSLPGTSNAAKLLPCTYCQKSVHFHCVGIRYKLKFPEPNEEFMCHHCISTVVQRRRRAEKRRLEKMDIEVPDEMEEIAIRQKRLKLATELVPGQEFECVSEQGKRCEDLGVLLVDARSRLDMYLKIAKGNDARRKLIHQMEKVQLG